MKRILTLVACAILALALSTPRALAHDGVGGLEYVGTYSAGSVPVAVFLVTDDDGSEALVLVPYVTVLGSDGWAYVFPSTIYAHSAVTVGFNAFEMD